MVETQKAKGRRGSDTSRISMRGFYGIVAVSTVIGLFTVVILNMATPLSLVYERMGSLGQGEGLQFWFEVGIRMVFFILITCAILFVSMHRMLWPISRCLSLIRAGQDPPGDVAEKALRRLLNLPFLFIPVNVVGWIVVPAVAFLSAYLGDVMDLHTALIFSVRASMVGLISSAIAFFRIEAHSREKLIPFFFPRGHLTEIKGAARMPISRRIRMAYRFGSLVPLTILVVTLFTLQWEVDSALISAEEYGRGIISFTLALGLVFFFTTGALNRLVSRSIVTPVENMLSVVSRVREGDYTLHIRVIGNDEIGVLADAGNTMIKGLAEREMIRTTFGRYVTPEIRDEILAGRIPLEGERREATVMFADLRNFTSFVENNRSEEVIAGMRAYFTAMHRAIRRHRGLVLQFVGDEIETVFGVPVHFEEHADAAIRAALEMREALEELNVERSNDGKPTFAHGIGIHSGKVLAGNSGSEEQSAYALIGSTVNVASRIQGLTKKVDCDILASQETVKRLTGSYNMEEQQPRMVKGYSKPIIVYNIVG